MTKRSFYLTLNILNVSLWIVKATYIFAILWACSYEIKHFIANSIMLSFIFWEIFFIYILFAIFEKYFPNSIFNKFAIELKTNKHNKIMALLLAYCYDFILLLFFALPELLKLDFLLLFIFIIMFELYFLGGVLIFYLSTFCLWKIEDKIKNFYNKKLSKNKTSK